jgi:hypothetical protein
LDRGKLPVGIRGDGREGLDNLALGRRPLFPYAAESDGIAIDRAMASRTARWCYTTRVLRISKTGAASLPNTAADPMG